MADPPQTAAYDRLRSKETVILNHSVKKCAAKVSQLQALVRAGEDKATCAQAAEVASRELGLYSLEVDMAELVAETCQQQLEDYRVLEAQVTSQVESTEADIEKLTEELRVAKKVRQYKEQYEALAKLVNRHPSKPTTTREQADLQIDIRKKQFALLMHTIDDLTRTLGEDPLEDDAEGQQGRRPGAEEGEEDEDEDANAKPSGKRQKT
jgi:THO complex subunit 7